MTQRFRTWIWLASFALLACTYNLPPLAATIERLPQRLSQTGLYADISLKRTAADVRAFTPNYELWSDGASKRRFIRLPPGTRIDTSNMDDWSFPVGTQLWKEFTRGGKRVETRLLQRVSGAVDGWAAAAYVWDHDQHEARLSVSGVSDAFETSHDVPEARTCAACHGGRASFVLGFSALQLTRETRSAHDLTLTDLVSAGLVSTAPTRELRIPGPATTQSALGYLHANCGNCHNSARPQAAQFVRPHSDLNMWLTQSGLTVVEQTETYRSALTEFVVPGKPEASPIWRRMQGPGFMHMKRRMPPIASEYRDARGSALVARWIESLPKTSQ